METLWWFLGVVFVVFFVYSMLPNLLTRVLSWQVIERLPDLKQVALTFDDGPDPVYTPRLLDALSEAGVCATFFVIAEKALEHPRIIERMVQEGHEVEVHGYTHLMVPLLTPRLTIKQLQESAQALLRGFGLQTRFYRPTWGLLNLVSLWYMSMRPNHRLVTWSIMVGDWKNISADLLLERISKRLHPGAIVVLHDSDETFGAKLGSPEHVIALIPGLAKLVRDEGYQFCTLEGRL